MTRPALGVSTLVLVAVLVACPAPTPPTPPPPAPPPGPPAPPPPPGFTILRPGDFTGTTTKTASVTLNNLGANESVAVIPVYATQDLDPDAFNFTLNVTGIAAANTPTATPAAHEHIDPATRTHLEFMERQGALTDRLLKAGIKPLSKRDGLGKQAFDKCAAPYAVGTKQCNFWVFNNFQAGTQVQIAATMRLASASAYWFVQNEDAADFTDAEIANLAQVFESTIVPSNKRYFGDFSDVDGNGKIFIVFSRVIGQSAGLFGYVDGTDLFADNPAQMGRRSNEGDIFYAATPGTLAGRTKAQHLLRLPATLTHELKHLITVSRRTLNNLPAEEPWLEEGSAQAAQELAGFGSQLVPGSPQLFATNALGAPQNARLVYAGTPQGAENGNIYGYSFTFLWRVAETVGHDNFWKSWTGGPGVGVANLEAKTNKKLADLMLDWASTLLFDHTNLVPGNPFDYKSLNLQDGTWTKLGRAPLSSGNGTARSMAYYLGKGSGGNATITFNTAHQNPFVIVARFTGTLP